MGAAIGQRIHSAVTGKANPIALPENHKTPVAQQSWQLLSALPGRRRYHMATLINNQAMAQLLEDKLGSLAYMDKVTVNTVTGNILFCYHCSEPIMDKLANWLKNSSFNGARTESISQSQPQPQPQLTTFVQNWHSTAQFFNQMVVKYTNGCLNASSLLSLFFLIRGLRKMILLGQRPTGPAMIWWAVHLMKERKL